jgi:sugar phosphate isomerase/epimerase
MVEFGTGYQMPMDREYMHDHGHHSFPADSPKETNDLGVSIGDLGVSMGLGPVPNVQAVNSRMRGGTKKLEFVFTGMGKGSAQGQTPGQYGKRQREALVEMGKANKIDFTTHSTVGIYGLSGMDQQGSFSKASKQNSLNELKRAVEFAADVGFGGPVVVHTGEFQRPIVDAEWNQKEGDPFRNKFTMYSDEEGRTSYRVVDQRSGRIIQEAQKNKKVSRPLWKRYDKGDNFWKNKDGSSYVDDTGKKVERGDYIDYFGNKVDSASRVPVYDEEKGTFKVTQMGWNELQKEADEMTVRAKKDFERWDSMSEKERKESIWGPRIEKAKDLGLSIDNVQIKPEEAYIIATLETNAANSRGWALQYGGDFMENIKAVKKLEEAKKFYKQLEDSTDPEERWKLKQSARSRYSEFIPPEEEFPSDMIDKQLRDLKHKMQHSQEASSSQWAQAEESMETIRHVESAESYAIREACDAYARSAISAMRQSDVLREKGKLKKPIAVALENLFPESYGSHPDELIKLVEGSREQMVQLLKQQGYSGQKAKQKAKDHITATLDVGHLNMWRKYWKGDEKKSLKDNDALFDKWIVGKVAELAKKKIVGHVHIDDNYGYHDDHLAPGQGNTPVKAMIKALKENGYDGEMIVEPGADFYTDTGNGFAALTKTWQHFGIPLYGGGGLGGQGRTWTDIQYGGFGRNQPPYFVFGGYSPTEEWTVWSGVPLD